MSDPKLWGQLPFDILSKILKVEKDRLDKVARDEHKILMEELREELFDLVEECNWWQDDDDPDPGEILYIMSFAFHQQGAVR